jgi:hypothetical protein
MTTTLTATVSGNNINLSWTSVSGVSSYILNRNGQSTTINGTSYTDLNATCGVYIYYVTPSGGSASNKVTAVSFVNCTASPGFTLIGSYDNISNSIIITPNSAYAPPSNSGALLIGYTGTANIIINPFYAQPATLSSANKVPSPGPGTYTFQMFLTDSNGNMVAASSPVTVTAGTPLIPSDWTNWLPYIVIGLAFFFLIIIVLIATAPKNKDKED